jgi:hypothetical protein
MKAYSQERNVTGITWAITIYLSLSALTTGIVIWCGTKHYEQKMRREKQRHNAPTETETVLSYVSKSLDINGPPLAISARSDEFIAACSADIAAESAARVARRENTSGVIAIQQVSAPGQISKPVFVPEPSSQSSGGETSLNQRSIRS